MIVNSEIRDIIDTKLKKMKSDSNEVWRIASIHIFNEMYNNINKDIYDKYDICILNCIYWSQDIKDELPTWEYYLPKLERVLKYIEDLKSYDELEIRLMMGLTSFDTYQHVAILLRPKHYDVVTPNFLQSVYAFMIKLKYYLEKEVKQNGDSK